MNTDKRGTAELFAFPEAPASNESRLGGTRSCELGCRKKEDRDIAELETDKSDPHKTRKTLIDKEGI
jgi:hypothetical protein